MLAASTHHERECLLRQLKKQKKGLLWQPTLALHACTSGVAGWISGWVRPGVLTQWVHLPWSCGCVCTRVHMCLCCILGGDGSPKVGELRSHMPCSAAKCTNNQTFTDLALTLRDRATLSVLYPLVLSLHRCRIPAMTEAWAPAPAQTCQVKLPVLPVRVLRTLSHLVSNLVGARRTRDSLSTVFWKALGCLSGLQPSFGY